MAAIGKNIRRLRNERQMTQDELAEKLYVSRQTISNYETGKSNPDIDMLLKITEVLQTDINILIYGPPEISNRERDIRRLIPAGVILIVLTAFCIFTSQWREYLLKNYFLYEPEYCVQLLLLPVILLLGGWLLMQLLKIFMKLKPLTGRAAALLFYPVLAVIIFYFICVLPFCIEMMHFFVSFLIQVRAGNSVDSSLIGNLFPEFIRLQSENFVFFYMSGLFGSSVFRSLVWFLCGMALWNRPRFVMPSRRGTTP